jgi:hypothetical protein
MKPKVTEGYDKKHRRTYSLDNRELCYLSFFFNEQWILESISFDVEAADDYHYTVGAAQLPKLCEFLRCPNLEADIVKVFRKQLKSWKKPIEIAELCKKAGIEYQVAYWY